MISPTAESAPCLAADHDWVHAGLQTPDLLASAIKSGNPACLALCTGWTARHLERAQTRLTASFPDLPLDPDAPGLLRARRCRACVEVSSRMAAMTQGTSLSCKWHMVRASSTIKMDQRIFRSLYAICCGLLASLLITAYASRFTESRPVSKQMFRLTSIATVSTG